MTTETLRELSNKLAIALGWARDFPENTNRADINAPWRDKEGIVQKRPDNWNFIIQLAVNHSVSFGVDDIHAWAHAPSRDSIPAGEIHYILSYQENMPVTGATKQTALMRCIIKVILMKLEVKNDN